MTRALVAVAIVLTLGGCERAMKDMYDQARFKPLREAPGLPRGDSSRELPKDSVLYSKGNLASTSSGNVGRREALDDAAAMNAQRLPSSITREFIERGRDRYTIYCVPCHSPLGDGDGRVARRGFPHPPSYHSERLRNAPDRHFFDVITNGYGVMYSYADRVTASERWAIVAYIRALQLSQNAEAARLPRDVQARLTTNDAAPKR